MMKKRLPILYLLCILLCLTGCGAKKKTMTAGGMSITLTEEFSEGSYSGADCYYESAKAIVMGIRESKSDLEGTGLEMNSLRDYASELLNANGISSSSIIDGNNYLYFEYENDVNGEKYSYMTCVYENGADYWMVNFACTKGDYDKLKDDFLKYADSVTFE